jgi:serine/threonine-protein kinase
LEQLLPIYWRPLYVYARRQGLAANHAEDAVQGFFLHLLEWVDPAPLDPAKASLRRYLKAAFDHYLVDVHQKDSLEGRHVAPLDTGPVERELSAAAQASEAAYDREWALALMERALGRLEQEEQHARRSEQTGIVLDYFRTDAVPDYAATAAACHMSVLQLKASLHRVRARFRELLTEEVADTLEEGDVEAEIGELLAVLARKVQLCQRCGAPLPSERLAACPLCVLSADIAAATLGDSLELREEIGRGGMGCVFKAHHRRLGRTVAVKLIAAPVAAQPGSRRLFEREAQALAKLDHPNVVAVHDFGEQDGQSYIVMEYVEGRPLSEMLPLAEEAAIAIALQVLDALAAAHGQGIVHRDIKPANILLDARGRVKVGDFGIARLLGEDPKGSTLTDSRSTWGTPQYMAPEALLGAPPDPRMDVYSVGVVLYEMVAGQKPIGTFEPLPGPLDGVVRKALAPDPGKRYESAEQMREELLRIRDELERTHARPARRDLGPGEVHWLRAVALLFSLATAVALWAILLSVTPRILESREVVPLVMIEGERLADGRIVSLARLEIGPTVAAVAMFAVSLLAYGLLRRHWRHAGLEIHASEQPLRESGPMLACGVIALLLYGLPRLFAGGSSTWRAARYLPILGGAMVAASLFLFWLAFLDASRTGRPLRREPRLWSGFALALLPTAVELLRYLRADRYH